MISPRAVDGPQSIRRNPFPPLTVSMSLNEQLLPTRRLPLNVRIRRTHTQRETDAQIADKDKEYSHLNNS